MCNLPNYKISENDLNGTFITISLFQSCHRGGEIGETIATNTTINTINTNDDEGTNPNAEDSNDESGSLQFPPIPYTHFSNYYYIICIV